MRNFREAPEPTAVSRKRGRVAPLRPPRFELGTYGLEIRCSIQLSYGRLRFSNSLEQRPHGASRRRINRNGWGTRTIKKTRSFLFRVGRSRPSSKQSYESTGCESEYVLVGGKESPGSF